MQRHDDIADAMNRAVRGPIAVLGASTWPNGSRCTPMQALIHSEAGIGIPLFLSSLDAHSAKLKGQSSIPLGGLMSYAFAENVWLES